MFLNKFYVIAIATLSLVQAAQAQNSLLRNRQVVFVGGFLNEGLNGYFTDNVAVARELGVEQVTIASPSSLSSVEHDAETLYGELQSLHARDSRKIILIGHSKGGAAAVLLGIMHPTAFDTMIDRIISIQGTIGGSPVADIVATACNFNFVIPGLCTNKWIGVGAGLESIRTKDSKELFHEHLVLMSPVDRAKASARTYYVRGVRRVSMMAPELKATGLYLRSWGENDGLVLAGDQMIAGYGKDLGIIVGADHASLTVSSWTSNSSAEYKRAFTRRMFDQALR